MEMVLCSRKLLARTPLGSSEAGAQAWRDVDGAWRLASVVGV
jgi:hypothetical protein